MSCSFYNNGGFGCGGCEHFVRTNSVTLTGNVLILNISVPLVALSNKQKICICVAQSIPSGASSADTVTVTIGAGATKYSMLTKVGNFVHADQIRSRRVYHTDFATDTGLFVVKNCELCPTDASFPVIAAANTAEVSSNE
jgi:hypothetical protein